MGGEIGLGKNNCKSGDSGKFYQEDDIWAKLWNMSKILQAEISKISSKEKNSGQKNVCQNRPKSILQMNKGEKWAISHFELGH